MNAPCYEPDVNHSVTTPLPIQISQRQPKLGLIDLTSFVHCGLNVSTNNTFKKKKKNKVNLACIVLIAYFLSSCVWSTCTTPAYGPGCHHDFGWKGVSVFPPQGPGSKLSSGDIILPLKKSWLRGVVHSKCTRALGLGLLLNLPDFHHHLQKSIAANQCISWPLIFDKSAWTHRGNHMTGGPKNH